MHRTVSTLLALSLLAAPSWTQDAAAPLVEISKPDLFEKSQKAAQQALEVYSHYDNPEEQRRMADIGYRLAQEARFRDFPFTFYLVDMAEPNAFALPGGQIFITRGMLDFGLNDDMLAGLLGHEIAHVTQRHGTRIQKQAMLLNILSQVLMAGVMVADSQRRKDPVPGIYGPYDRVDRGGDLLQGTVAAGAVVSELLLRSHSREFEDEADDEGQRMAAAAGFDPDGTRQLMDTMRAHMPQSRDYGYWRTHPFFEDRVRAADVRDDLLKIQEPRSANEYRTATQEVLLAWVDSGAADEEMIELVRREALLAWPQGKLADGIRLDHLHARRDSELARDTLARDFGRLIDAYEGQVQEVRELTPDSGLVAGLEREIRDFENQRQKIYPQAAEVVRGGVFQTQFLETFLSNFPDAAEAPVVSLALADAYSRLNRQNEAVTYYLEAADKGPVGGTGDQAHAGLRRLAPGLQQLSALQKLADQDADPELQALAEERLSLLAGTYEEMTNGAQYLDEYPHGPQREDVSARLEELADDLLGEVVLYQTVGDDVKAIECMQQILTHAPLSPAAERLRERMLLEG